MAVITDTKVVRPSGLRELAARLWRPFATVPTLGWLVAGLVPAAVEFVRIPGAQSVGALLARGLGMPRIPALFGLVLVLDQPALIPSALLYNLLVYILPVALVAWLIRRPANQLAGWLLRFPLAYSTAIHLGLLFAILMMWAGVSDYRLLVARLTLIAVIVTLSLNVVNGYMGEFSCSHPGFMALGAYVSSVFTIVLFVNENRFGDAVLPVGLGPWLFPLSLVLGGAAAAVGALLVAIPSFRTRGDYLAIISLAFMFIVKSLFENLEVVGGPRGLSNQPDYASLPVIFVWTGLSIWIINNFVSSTMGKALNAVRDGELAANAMTVDTRRTKMVAFLFAAFWAGIAGGLFAHVLRYINPDTFGIRKLAEVLAMVYLGGLNSVAGSVVGAVGFNLLSEALRPLEILKWILIPVLLILLMIFRPTGLLAFRTFDPAGLLRPKTGRTDEV